MLSGCDDDDQNKKTAAFLNGAVNLKQSLYEIIKTTMRFTTEGSKGNKIYSVR